MINYLIKTFEITEEEASLFSSCFQLKKYRKHEKFISFGQISNKVGFVKSGIFKCELIGTNKRVVDDFVFENQFVSNHYSFLTKQKSQKEITCMDDSTIKVISRDQLNLLAQQHSFIESMARQVNEMLFLRTHQKLTALKLQSAEERYLSLISSNKTVIEKIPQYDIASYLNVSPETISRIRKKLSTRS